mmetsp:Transcript_28692/g.42390  ORF Transcript_28692/g.42390 Transcript_28692/m.42390 type:complete len:80 (+) Transcript_28692:109-348(+)
MSSANIQDALAHAAKTFQDALQSDHCNSSAATNTTPDTTKTTINPDDWASRMVPPLQANDWGKLYRLLSNQQGSNTSSP